MSIKIEKVEVYGMEDALRGMRNPKNAWHLSDSGYTCPHGEYLDGIKQLPYAEEMILVKQEYL